MRFKEETYAPTVYTPSEEDLLCLFCKNFYYTAITNEMELDRLNAIIEHCSWENEQFTLMIIDLCVERSTSGLLSEARVYSSILVNELALKDSLQQTRANYTLTKAGNRGLLEVPFTIEANGRGSLSSHTVRFCTRTGTKRSKRGSSACRCSLTWQQAIQISKTWSDRNRHRASMTHT